MKKLYRKGLALAAATSMLITALPAVSLAEESVSANVTFEAKAGGTVLKEIAYEPGFYNFEDDWSGIDVSVDVHVVEIPADCTSVDLTFSENVIAYNYDEEGNYLDRWYDDYMTGDKEAANVSVDSNEDGVLDYILVQTPYDEDYTTTILYAVRFSYALDYTATANGEELEVSSTSNLAYEYLVYGTTSPVLCDLETITIPAGTEEVSLSFNQNVLVYNYDGEGNYLAGWVSDFMTGSDSYTVSVDSDGDGNLDFLQIQTPYDENWSSSILRAVTFVYAEEETEEETSEAESSEEETTEAETGEEETTEDGTTEEETTEEETTQEAASEEQTTEAGIEETTPVEETTQAVEESGAAVDQALLSDIYVATGNYLNKKLSENPITGMEWYIIALCRGRYDIASEVLDTYYENLCAALEDNDGELSSYATTNARTIMGLTAAGFDPEDVNGYNLLTALADYDEISSQGLNGIMYALIALDCGDYEVPEADAKTPVTREKLVSAILDAQLADNGWAYSGTTGDPDMTSIAIEALAPYYASNADVKAAVDKAVEFLSDLQNDDGTYTSWGTANSDSTAQVIIAISTLGIDADTDERFIKNDVSVLQALLTYYLPEASGSASPMSFRLLADGDETGGFGYDNAKSINDYSTVESYNAMTAYYRNAVGEKTLYDMADKTEEAEEKTTEETSEETTEESSESEESTEAETEASEEETEEEETTLEEATEEETNAAEETTKASEETDKSPETTASEPAATTEAANTSSNTSKVDSGDSNHMMYTWILLMAVSAGIGAFALKSRKRTK